MLQINRVVWHAYVFGLVANHRIDSVNRLFPKVGQIDGQNEMVGVVLPFGRSQILVIEVKSDLLTRPSLSVALADRWINELAASSSEF